MNGLGCACQREIGFGSYLGLGDVEFDDSGNPIDPIIVSGGDQGILPVVIPTGPSLPQGPLSSVATGAPVSSGNAALDNALASIAAQWTKIAGQTIAPQTTITTPSGLQVQTPAGQTSNLASLFAGTSLVRGTGSVNFSALLPWIFMGGAGLFALKALGK